MSCREREVVLVRGPPWGFRVTGGSDTVHALKEAQTILNSVTDKLILKLHNKRGEEQKKKKMENKNILTSDLTSPILAVSIDQARLPLPCSPEYILLRKSREKKRSGSLSSLPDCSQLTGSMSVSSEEDTTSSSSASASTSESSSRSERQTAWLRSLKQTKTTKTKMKIIKKMLERDYESEPETEVSLDQQMEYYLANLANSNPPTQKHLKPTKSKQQITRRTGRIENFVSDGIRGISPRISHTKEADQHQTKYLHQILAEGGGDQVLTVKKAPGPERLEDGRSVYRSIQSGGDIPSRGLAATSSQDSRPGSRSDSRAEYTEEKFNIHYRTVVRSEVKEELPEDVLEKALEEKMLKVYKDMERRKKEKVEEDNERRRHGDNFLPREKSSVIIPPYRDQDQHQDEAPGKPSRPLLRLRARALYSFVAETERELSFQAGNVLFVTGELDHNWLRGEIAGRTGIFPSSYVEFLANSSTAGLRVRARYNFKAKQPGELTMLRGEMLVIERSRDVNWVEVRLGERTGLVPLSYLQSCEEEMEDTKSVNTSTPSTPERPHLSGVLSERLYKPTDLLKCKLRGEFQDREKKMVDLDQLIYQTMQEFCPENMPSQNNHDGGNTNGIRNHSDGGDLFRQAVVVEAHEPQAAGELQLAVGDRLSLLQDFQDGWMAGREKSSGQLGLFPSSCLKPL